MDDICQNAGLRDELMLLEDNPHLSANHAGPRSRMATRKGNRAEGWFNQPGTQSHQSRFSCTIRTQQSDAFAGLDRETDPIQNSVLPIAKRHIADIEQGCDEDRGGWRAYDVINGWERQVVRSLLCETSFVLRHNRHQKSSGETACRHISDCLRPPEGP